MYNVIIFGMTTNPGGVESFIMNYYEKMDHCIIHFDFLANTHEKIAYEDKLKQMGSKVFHITPRSKNPILYRRELKKFFKDNANKYDCIWVNVNSLANIDYLKLAKKYGIKRRIIHSHNSKNMDSKIRGYLHYFNRLRIKNYATDFWACSKDAATWFYNQKIIDKSKIINNAINIDKIKFDNEKRVRIRNQYNLNNSFVLGNIGRLHFQKNQTFILEVLKYLVENKIDTKLIFVGDGPDKDSLKKEVNKLNLKDKVLFVGIQSDIAAWLSSFDIFIFPSLFEGLPIAGLEAQANGVPIIASVEAINSEARINNNISIIELNKGAQYWGQYIEENIKNNKFKRTSYLKVKHNFDLYGFNIEKEVSKLEKDLMIDE